MVKKITKAGIIGLYTSDYSKKYYLRELAFLIKRPHQSIKSYLDMLVKEKILIKIERMNITEYGLNFKNKGVYDYLVIAEKERLIERLLEDTLLKVLFEKLSVFLEKNTFIIFGSAVEKIQEGRDIDLLVIGKQDISKEVNNFRDIYNRKIHKIQVADIKRLSAALVGEIYKKHLILNNTEEIIRFFGGLHEQNKLV